MSTARLKIPALKQRNSSNSRKCHDVLRGRFRDFWAVAFIVLLVINLGYHDTGRKINRQQYVLFLLSNRYVSRRLFSNSSYAGQGADGKH
jgi:hypothetical protein